MKKISVLLAALLGGVALNSNAAGFFVGGETGRTIYPDFTEAVTQSLINGGTTYPIVTQQKRSTALGVFFGQWLTDNFGWEAADTNLGNIRGTVTDSTIPTLNTTYKYAASAITVAALGGIKLGRASTLYGKAGLYRASVDFDHALVNNFSSDTRSVTTDSTGLVFGAGYSIRFMDHWVGKAELAVYNGVKFQTYNAVPGTNTSHNITKATVGIAYVF